jgi:general stress protein 26
MKTDTNDLTAVETRLWEEIHKAGGTGMLGLVNSNDHYQPMTAFVERDIHQVWFFTRKDTDLAQAADGGVAMFVFQADRLQACIAGALSPVVDRERVDKYWNAVVAAWYPDGKDDPQLTMLRLDCRDAEVWISDDGPVKFAWKIAKANATHTTPDEGGRAHLDFH